MEKQNNILEKYIRGSISEEEYNELQQQIQNDSDNSVGDMLNECWQKDLNIHVMPRAAKERTRRLVNEKIKKTRLVQTGVDHCSFYSGTRINHLYSLFL